MKFTFKNSLILFILTPILIFYFVLFITINTKFSDYSENNKDRISKEIIDKYQISFQEKIKSVIEHLDIFKEVIAEASHSTSTSDEEKIKGFLKEFILKNIEYNSVWFVSNYEDTDSRESITVYHYIKQFNKLDYISYSGKIRNKIQSNLYSVIKESNKNSLIFYESESSNSNDETALSVAVPMYTDNKFEGVIGIDIDISKVALFFKEIQSDITEEVYLLSDNLSFNLLKNSIVDNEFQNFLKREKVFTKIEANKRIQFNREMNNVNYYVDILPLKFNADSRNLAVMTTTPVKKLSHKNSVFVMPYLIVVLIGILILILIISFINIWFKRRFKETSDVLDAIAHGKSDQIKILPDTENEELTVINRSINSINTNLNQISEFINEIGKGNFDYQYESMGKEDFIAKSLTDLKKNLEISKTEEIKRKEEDERLNWTTGGSAKFAEIIREHSDNLEELSYAIISELVNYIDANQGGLFIINEDENNERFIELLASYAYDRKKMFEKRIPEGVGLVGRCIQERETIYMTRVPSDYLNITSGLGKENPGTLLIVPLIFHEEVFGVVELASFKVIEEYKIKLVEQVSEGIASAISMVKINVRTTELLKETKIKSEQAASQEEEIRQNVEEMQAATDELNKKLDNVIGSLDAIKSVTNIAEFDLSGRVTDISDNFLEVLQKDRSEVLGKFQGSFSKEQPNVDSFKLFWRELKRGNKKEYEQMISIGDEVVRLYSVYIPVMNSDGEVYKVTSFAKVIT